MPPPRKRASGARQRQDDAAHADAELVHAGHVEHRSIVEEVHAVGKGESDAASAKCAHFFSGIALALTSSR
jgi:hypothetical protein